MIFLNFTLTDWHASISFSEDSSSALDVGIHRNQLLSDLELNNLSQTTDLILLFNYFSVAFDSICSESIIANAFCAVLEEMLEMLCQ